MLLPASSRPTASAAATPEPTFSLPAISTPITVRPPIRPWTGENPRITRRCTRRHTAPAAAYAARPAAASFPAALENTAPGVDAAVNLPAVDHSKFFFFGCYWMGKKMVL